MLFRIRIARRRRWHLRILLTFFILLVLLLLNVPYGSRWPPSRLIGHLMMQGMLPILWQDSPDYRPARKPYAYATLLCDDVMTDSIKVLIYSLKKYGGEDYPFLVLVLPEVKQREELIALGAQLYEISPLEYPFRVTAEKAAINKMCRYSKLHIWRFIEYSKIIFIDVDCLVVQKIDSAFEWPEFSAVRDAGDTFNTGLFVLEPSLETWQRMRDTYFSAPSYNQGDQGFINWFFRNSSKSALPASYNTVCKHKGHALWPLLKRQAKMIHYTSETKPWNFFSSSHKYWRYNFDASMYYLWSRTFRTVSQQLLIDVHSPSKPIWLNRKRATEICERFFPTIENDDLKSASGMDGENNHGHAHAHAYTHVHSQTHPLSNSNSSLNFHGHGNNIRNKFSIILVKWRNAATLSRAINHYRFVLGSIVHRIYISWNPSLGTPGAEMARFRFLKEPPLVEIIYHRFESANNIWNPIVGLATKAVFIADDEHLLDFEKMEVAFETWKNNPHALVGFFARYHLRQKFMGDPYFTDLTPQAVEMVANSSTGALLEESNPEKMQSMTNLTSLNSSDPLPPPPQNIPALMPSEEHWIWSYNLTSVRRPRPYSLMSSQLLMLSSEYLFIYTCLLPERIHRHIDEQAEDISDFAMNLMVAGMTGTRPVLVKSDYSDPESGRFSNEAWALTRGELLKNLARLFTGTTKDPLQYNSVLVAQFNKIPFKKRSVKQWNKYA